jgi:LysR family glycine cleavage system transcriptional activator
MRLTPSSVLRQLRVFCLCARTLSFKSAAGQLHLTPSAVSHQVRELEEYLGARLFKRRTRALELTPEGRELLQACEPAFAALDDALRSVSRRGRRKVLRIVLPPLFESEAFMPRLSRLFEAQPDIDIQVTSHDPRPTEHPSNADVSVLVLESAPTGLVSHELFELRLVAVCSPAIAERAQRLGRNLFKESALIVNRLRRDAWERWAEDNALSPPEPRMVIEFESHLAVVRAAEQGLGVALVPDIAGASWIERGTLQRFSRDTVSMGDKYFLVYRPEDAQRPEVQAFRDWALEEFLAPEAGTAA